MSRWQLELMGFEACLVPDGLLGQLAADLDAERVRENVASSLWSHRAMQFGRFLEQVPERLPVEYQDELTIYYTRLYWANRLVATARRDLGPDAGLEQWAHKIFESAPDAQIDWEIVAEIFQATDQLSAE